VSSVKKQRRESTLVGLRIQGFKSLRDLTEVHFRPLTILAGANSSGKSSLMQPLLLLKQTFDAPYDPGPLLLDGPHVAFSDVRQIFWYAAGKQQSKRFTIGIESSRQNGVEITFERVKGRTKAHPESLQIVECVWQDKKDRLELRIGMSGEEIAEAASYPWSGLPKKLRLPKELQRRVTVVRSRAFLVIGIEEGISWPGPWMSFEPLLRAFIHVPGLRGNPARTYKQTAVENYFPGVFQDYVASVVARWQSEKPDLLQALGKDLHQLGLTWKVEARQISATEVELRTGRLQESRRGGARDMVSIADVALGVSQVLPVVVSLLAAQPGQVVYLEQPEIHLHPRAQVALADLLVRAVQRGVQVIAETHGELLLLGIQSLVAAGQLDPEMVKLHWFDRDEEGATQVTSADLDEQGTFGDWPVDFADVSMGAMHAYLDATAVREVA